VIELEVSGIGLLRLDHLVLDLNGTIAVDGQVLSGVAERLARLSGQLTIHLLSADTRGRATQTAHQLGLHLTRVMPGNEAHQKGQFVADLGSTGVVAIGNGANDRMMLEAAALGIAVAGPEGLAVAALTAADIVVSSSGDALDLLLNPQRLIATLRQ
jgi:P-type E1-E2 ATPase